MIMRQSEYELQCEIEVIYSAYKAPKTKDVAYVNAL